LTEFDWDVRRTFLPLIERERIETNEDSIEREADLRAL